MFYVNIIAQSRRTTFCIKKNVGYFFILYVSKSYIPKPMTSILIHVIILLFIIHCNIFLTIHGEKTDSLDEKHKYMMNKPINTKKINLVKYSCDKSYYFFNFIIFYGFQLFFIGEKTYLIKEHD